MRAFQPADVFKLSTGKLANQKPNIKQNCQYFQPIPWLGLAALISKVHEVDPLCCPDRGSAIQIIGYIGNCQPQVVESILRHCGLWKGLP